MLSESNPSNLERGSRQKLLNPRSTAKEMVTSI